MSNSPEKIFGSLSDWHPTRPMLNVGQADNWEPAVWLRPTRPTAENSNSGREVPAKSLNCCGETMEKRLPIAVVVNLASARDYAANGAELTYTNNVSAHGACVVSNHHWQPGEIAEVSSFSDQNLMRGKVVYCRKHGDDQYAIGLNFQNNTVIWSVYLKYSGRAPDTATLRQRVTR